MKVELIYFSKKEYRIMKHEMAVRLQKKVRLALNNFIADKGTNTINLSEAMEVFAKGHFDNMTDGSMISDDCLLSSIGYGNAVECISPYLQLDLGFSQETIDKMTLSSLEGMFRMELFAIRNTDRIEQIVFSMSNQKMELFAKNMKDPAMIEQAEKLIAITA
jgi:hypothetical protein